MKVTPGRSINFQEGAKFVNLDVDVSDAIAKVFPIEPVITQVVFR
jgi:hypothetical protein